MAQRGTPLSAEEQRRLLRLRQALSVRAAARESGVSKTTVQKYTGKKK